MSDSAKRVQGELESLGYEAQTFTSGMGVVVAFNYIIETGSHKGRPVWVGVSFQEEEYPEYPPHWVHVSPPIPDGRGGSVQTYEMDGCQWLAMSRPPGRFWDQLRTKHMISYINEHLRKIWKDV
jgi:hypothetical protein